MNNPFFNKDEGRLRSLIRVLLQFALLYGMISCLQIAFPALLQFCFSNEAATILSYDSSQFVVVLIAVLSSILLSLRFLDKRSLSKLGVIKDLLAIPEYIYGFLLALCLVGVMFAIELNTGSARVLSINTKQLGDPSFILGIGDGLLACLMIGFQEEILRFYQIKNISEGMGGHSKLGKQTAVMLATLLAAIFFGLLHLRNNGITFEAVIFLILDGIFLSLAYITTGRAWLAFGFHAGWDFAEGNIFGFAVSGYPEKYSLLKIEQSGPAIFTGAGFGPDGGLINLVMACLGTLGILLWVYFRYRKIKLNESLCDWDSP